VELDADWSRAEILARVIEGESLWLARKLKGPLGPEAKDVLTVAAKSGNIHAVAALGASEVAEAEALLLQLAREADVCTQFVALRALGDLGAKQRPTLDYLGKRRKTSTGALRWATLNAISNSSSYAAENLISELNRPASPFTGDVLLWYEQVVRVSWPTNPWDVGLPTKRGLHKQTEALSVIARLDTSPFRRIAALRCFAALGRYGIGALRWALANDDDDLVRTEAAGMLLSLGHELDAAIARLAVSLLDGYADLQVRAAEIMAASGRREFVNDLKQIAEIYGNEDAPTGHWAWRKHRYKLRSRVAMAARVAAEKLERGDAPVEDRRHLLKRRLPGEKF
jgi:HEAT repeat protein